MLKIAGLEKESFVDGVGVRYAVFVQGCKHNCYGCHNPETHNFDGGHYVDINDIFEDVKKADWLDGITLSGGDPFYQAAECAELAKRVKEELGINVWAYTGFLIEDLLKSDDCGIQNLLKYTDVLVDGPFVLAKRSLALRFRGSSNQRILDIKKSIQENKAVLYELKE